MQANMLQEGQEILEGRFKIIKKLGSGAFGEIFKGKSPLAQPIFSRNTSAAGFRGWVFWVYFFKSLVNLPMALM